MDNNTTFAIIANLSDLLNLTKNTAAWYEDDGTMEWLFVSSFIWIMLATVVCLILFFCNKNVRSNRSSVLSMNILISVIINEVFLSVTLIYHDAIGIPRHWTFGVHYCRFVILAQTFSVSLQSFTVLLVTADAWFQLFSPAKYNEKLTSRRIFYVLAVSPWLLAILGVLLITLPLSPSIGRLMTYKDHTFCFLDIQRGVYHSWVIAFVFINFLLPATGSFLLACALVFTLCRRLSAYQSFGATSMRDGENRAKHVIVAIFLMNLVFVCMSGPFVWSRLTKDYSTYKESRVVLRVYWCLLPLIWLMLQPELVAVVTSSVRRCWRLGPREALGACVDAVRRRDGAGTSHIREYNVNDKTDIIENGAL